MISKQLHVFDVEPIYTVPDCSCLGVWSGNILVGTERGDLLTLKLPEAGGAGTARARPVVQTKRALTVGAVLQLHVDEQRAMLFCLGREGVRVCRLPRLLLKAQVSGTKGACAFAWHSPSGTLATAYKKKLSFFSLDGLEFVSSRDVGLPEPIMCMEFVGSTLCVGLTREYYCVWPDTGQATSLASHTSDTPCMTALSGTEVLLSLGAETAQYRLPDGAHGAVRLGSIAWSSPPAALASSPPYALASLRDGELEARPVEALSSAALFQRLGGVAEGAEGAEGAQGAKGAEGAEALENPAPAPAGPTVPSLLCAAPLPGRALVAADPTGTVTRLAQRPALALAASLLELGEYEECLALAATAPVAARKERRALEDEAHLRYAAALFAQGAYEESMLHFGASAAAGTRALLGLLPSLTCPEHLAALEREEEGRGLAGPRPPAPPSQEEPTGEEFVKAVAVVLPHLLSRRNRESLQSPASPGGQPSASATAVDTTILRALLALPDSGALLHFIQRPNCVDLEVGRAALRAAGRYYELVTLYQGRGCHSEALGLLENLSTNPEGLEVPAQGASAELKGLPGVWAAVRYLLSLDAGQLSLISTHSRWILEADPDAGLQMFTSIGLDPSIVLPILNAHAPALAGSYLEEVLANGQADPAVHEQDLASLYLRKVVRHVAEDPTDTEAHGLPETAKLRTLILQSSHLKLQPLLALLPVNQLLELRGSILERLSRHQEVLRLYVHQLGQLAAAEAYCDRVYQRQTLSLAARRRTGHAKPEVVGEEGRDAEAGISPPERIDSLNLPMLRLWLDRTGQRPGGWGAPQPSDIYLLLIQVLLEDPGTSRAGDAGAPSHAPPKASLQRWADVAALLGRKRGAIQPLHALELLPRELPLARAARFVHSTLWGGQEERRAASIRRSLRQAEAVGLATQLANAEKRSITLAPERLCTLCYKRVGHSAFVAFPDGMLAHFSCHRRAGNAGGKGE